VLQSLLGCYPLLWVIDKNASEEIEKLSVEVGMAGYGILMLSVVATQVLKKNVRVASSSP
jgi:hypothetical protein